MFPSEQLHINVHIRKTQEAKINLCCTKSHFIVSGSSRCCYRQILKIIVYWKVISCCVIHKFLQNTGALSNNIITSHHTCWRMAAKLHEYVTQEAKNTHNGPSGVFLTEQTWFTNTLKLQRKLNLISYYLAQLLRYEYATSVRSLPSKTRVVNCFPSLSITCITSSSSISITKSRLSFFKCSQLSAIRRTVSPLNFCWKETSLLLWLKQHL